MKSKLILLLAASMLMAATSFMVMAGEPAEENRGAEEMVLFGGKTGEVPFPHMTHQTKLESCDVCHGYFPQEKGVIEKMKAEGDLKAKVVMGQCTSCHKKLKKAGEETGPTSCRACHKKKK